MNNKTYKANRSYRKNPRLEYQKFRVRGHIRSFRDLEIYKQTTRLSSQIFDLSLPQNIKNKKLLEKELELLRNISKQVPRLIAESWGDRFTSRSQAYAKLEKAMEYIRHLVAKLDFLIATVDHQESRQEFVKLIRKYQVQRRKILNLKNAWLRIEEKRNN